MTCTSTALNDLGRLQVDQSNAQNIRVRLNVIGRSPLLPQQGRSERQSIYTLLRYAYRAGHPLDPGCSLAGL